MNNAWGEEQQQQHSPRFYHFSGSLVTGWQEQSFNQSDSGTECIISGGSTLSYKVT